jgi:hypothetical protein
VVESRFFKAREVLLVGREHPLHPDFDRHHHRYLLLVVEPNYRKQLVQVPQLEIASALEGVLATNSRFARIRCLSSFAVDWTKRSESTANEKRQRINLTIWMESGGRDELNSKSLAIPTPFAMLRACHPNLLGGRLLAYSAKTAQTA